MKKRYLLPFLFCLLQAGLTENTVLAQTTATEQQIPRKSWESEKIGRGMHWRYYHGNDLFNSRQSINVLDIHLKKAGVELSIAHSDSALIKTSRFAQEQGAVAAINGSYFDTRKGGSVVFHKANGEVKTTTVATLPEYRENGAVAVDAAGKPALLPKPATGWAAVDVPEALASGPLLVFDGEVQAMEPQAFNTNRHPRTAIGFTKDNRLLLVTVDGRSSEAYGMTNTELAQLMRSLGCEQALNLDGGGSTTLWIAGKGKDGIVNYPSDNKAYDHDGERAVANSILIKKKN